jgi:hypothetical protein
MNFMKHFKGEAQGISSETSGLVNFSSRKDPVEHNFVT